MGQADLVLWSGIALGMLRLMWLHLGWLGGREGSGRWGSGLRGLQTSLGGYREALGEGVGEGGERVRQAYGQERGSDARCFWLMGRGCLDMSSCACGSLQSLHEGPLQPNAHGRVATQ